MSYPFAHRFRECLVWLFATDGYSWAGIGRELCKRQEGLMLAGRTTPLRILIATSDVIAARALAEQVRRAGHHPVLATDGPGVLEWFEREADRPHSLDLAVLDAALPGYPGVALAACARTNALGVPLVLVQDPKVRIGAEWLARLGLLGILGNPIDADEFRMLLEDVSRPRLARGTSTGLGPSPT
jgi:CheY-like chemotaxis protein